MYLMYVMYVSMPQTRGDLLRCSTKHCNSVTPVAKSKVPTAGRTMPGCGTKYIQSPTPKITTSGQVDEQSEEGAGKDWEDENESMTDKIRQNIESNIKLLYNHLL